MSHSMSLEAIAARRKKYFNVFWGLVALTVIELVIVALPLPKMLMAVLVGIFSSAKAVVVGWYYMHLEHETRWLQIVACLPVIAFGYAFVLIVDTPSRPVSAYHNEPARVFTEEHLNHGKEQAKTKFAPEAEALPEGAKVIEATSSYNNSGGDAAAPTKEEASGPEAAPAAGSKTEAAPAAGGADSWN
jgi:caa(3)-type oxidase subunit IV